MADNCIPLSFCESAKLLPVARSCLDFPRVFLDLQGFVRICWDLHQCDGECVTAWLRVDLRCFSFHYELLQHSSPVALKAKVAVMQVFASPAMVVLAPRRAHPRKQPQRSLVKVNDVVPLHLMLSRPVQLVAKQLLLTLFLLIRHILQRNGRAPLHPQAQRSQEPPHPPNVLQLHEKREGQGLTVCLPASNVPVISLSAACVS